MQLDAGDVVHAEGDVEFLVIGVALDALRAEVFQVVVPAAHGARYQHLLCRVVLVVIAVVGLHARRVAEVQRSDLRTQFALVEEEQGAHLVAGSGHQAFQQRPPGAFVQHAFVAEIDQIVVELIHWRHASLRG
ncbi:hypothetical protein D3C84_740740 [compost metagenome]